MLWPKLCGLRSPGGPLEPYQEDRTRSRSWRNEPRSRSSYLFLKGVLIFKAGECRLISDGSTRLFGIKRWEQENTGRLYRPVRQSAAEPA